jgi:ABC-type antimicrobial peptide transport system permease subunit
MPPTFYPSYRQMRPRALGAMEFEVKTAANTESILRAVRETVRKIDPNLPVFDVRTQRAQIDATMMRQNLFAMLTSALGGLALMLTCVGIYGIMSHSVSRRTNEIGIRMALGARAGQVLGMILGESGRLIAVGIAIGGAAAWWLASYVESMLYGVKGADTATLAAAVGILCGVGLFAAWWPARRASRVAPMTALRHE